MKLLGAFLSLVFAVYTGVQAYQIAAVGASQQIPQLQGDGGGGLIFALLCAVSAIFVWRRTMIGFWLLVFAGLLGGFVGLSFGDPVLYWWSAIAIGLAAFAFLAHRFSLRHQTRYGTATRKRSREV